MIKSTEIWWNMVNYGEIRYKLGCKSWEFQPTWNSKLGYFCHTLHQCNWPLCPTSCSASSMSCFQATSDFNGQWPKVWPNLAPIFSENSKWSTFSSVHIKSFDTHFFFDRKLRSGGWIADRSFCCEFHGCEVRSLPQWRWDTEGAEIRHVSRYPLVNVYITMENHHFQWDNPL